MTKEEIFKEKQSDIIGGLNLALITVAGDNDFENLRIHVDRTIKMLQEEIEAIDSVDEFLKLQEIIFG